MLDRVVLRKQVQSVICNNNKQFNLQLATIPFNKVFHIKKVNFKSTHLHKMLYSCRCIYKTYFMKDVLRKVLARNNNLQNSR